MAAYASEGARPVPGAVYFFADDGVNGTELWKSDGTFNGTLLFDINTGNN